MKICFKCTIAATLCFMGTAYGLEVSNSYLSLSGGLSKAATVKNRDADIIYKTELFRAPGIVERTTIKFKNGMSIRAAIGGKFGDFRLELEPSYVKNKYKSFFDKDGDPFIWNLSGHLEAISGLVNAYYDLPINETFAPFVGMGVGVSRVKNSIRQSNLVNVVGGVVRSAPDRVGHMSETSLAYQGILGTLLHLNEKFALSIDYRYFSTAKKLKALDKKFQNQSINMGIVYNF